MKNFLLLSVMAFTSAQAFAYSESDIVGTWQCSANDAASGMVMQSTDTYSRDGKSSAKGTFALKIPGLAQAVTVNMSSRGTWSLRGNTISGKLISADANSPQFPQLASIFKQQIRRNMSANSQIVSLTKNKMRLRVSDQNVQVNCRR